MSILIDKKILIFLLAGFILAFLIPVTPVMSDEASTEAEVEVLPEEDISYGSRISGSRNAMYPGRALDAPDGDGAAIFLNGWINIQLQKKVPIAAKISVWAANYGWQHSKIKVYVSEDGRKWKLIGQLKIEEHGFQWYDFTGSFKNVKYIKVSRSGGLLSWLLLDAVGAKGGDDGKKKS